MYDLYGLYMLFPGNDRLSSLCFSIPNASKDASNEKVHILNQLRLQECGIDFI